MAYLEIWQTRSAIGRQRVQKRTIEALGIKRLHQRVIHEDTPQIRGMIRKTLHLVEVREIERTGSPTASGDAC